MELTILEEKYEPLFIKTYSITCSTLMLMLKHKQHELWVGARDKTG